MLITKSVMKGRQLIYISFLSDFHTSAPRNVFAERSLLFYCCCYNSRFVAKDDVTGVSQLKASVQRGIRAKIIEQYPAIEEWIAEIAPKKETIVLIKW